VWHVAGPHDSYAARRRAESWLATLKKAGAAVPPVLFGDWSVESGYQAGLRLAVQPGVTAVFAANDQMALGAMRALQEADRGIPEDVSVVGFDDIEVAGYLSPPLTTVRQDFDLVGERCVELLVDQIENRRSVPAETVLVAPRLVVRGSAAAPPAP
jgi:DNA-binding LacI/PurR family transcriptional regulator